MPNLMLRSLIGALALSAAGPALAAVTPSFAPKTDLARLAQIEINSAKAQIDVVLPDLDDLVLNEALLYAAKAGRAVRVLSTASVQGMLKERCRPCDRLEMAGADVRYLETKIRERFLVLDGPRGKTASGLAARVLVPSGNLGAPGRDQSLLVFARESDFALSYQDEFNQLWSKAVDYDDTAKRARVETVKVPSAPYALFSSANLVPLPLDDHGWLFTPSLDRRAGVLTSSLVTAIDQAYGTIEISSPRSPSKEVYRALTAAIERGVQVRMLLDASAYDGKKRASACGVKAKAKLLDECLALFGADVRYLGPDRDESRLESQYLLIDGKNLLTGAFAWSQSGERNSLGQMASLRGGVAAAFYWRFEGLFQAATNPLQKKTRGAVAGFKVATLEY